MKQTLQNIIPTLLLDRRYRPLCYLGVAFVLGILTVNMVLNNLSYLELTDHRHLVWLIYICAMLLLVLGNVMVLVPRFLLRGRLPLYMLSVFGMISLSLSGLATVQFLILPEERIMNKIGDITLFLNILSSFASMFFLVAGSSAIVLFRYWMEGNRRIRELKTATLQSELELLKQQINPHFLFNMLNNVNVLIWKKPAEAKRILSRLEALLRYQLDGKNKEEVCLTEDIRFLTDFLNLEKIRRDTFEFSISCEGEIGNLRVPSLLFIPFVENAVKHNPDNTGISYVRLLFRAKDSRLLFRCENSKPTRTNIQHATGGIGMRNIQRRLALLYPERHSLTIRDEDRAYTVTLTLEL